MFKELEPNGGLAVHLIDLLARSTFPLMTALCHYRASTVDQLPRPILLQRRIYVNTVEQDDKTGDFMV